MTARQLVWDMDGTLLDSTQVVPAAFAAAVSQLGGPQIEPAQVVASYSVGSTEVLLAHLLGRPLAAGEADVYYHQLDRADVLPYPGIAEVVARLRQRGHPIAVFTGASSRAAQLLLQSAGILVDVLVGGDEVTRPKPDPGGLVKAAERLGITPADLAYIGDSPLDLRAAKAAGSRAVAAAWGHQYERGEPAAITLAAPLNALDLLT
jgi:HAD superfamily hydrolase (TIGR01509 family)